MNDPELVKTFKRVFNSEDGKEVLQYMENELYIHRTTFDPDPHAMAFYEGHRRVVLLIKQILKTDPSKLIDQKEEQRKIEESYV